MKEKRIYSAFCIANILAALCLMVVLKKDLISFGIRDAYFDNILHNGIFSVLADTVESTSLVISISLLVLSVIAVLVSTQFWGSREYVIAFRLLVSTMIINVSVSAGYILNNIILGNCRITKYIGVLMIGFVLVPGFVLAIVLGRTNALNERKKKVDAILLGGIIVACAVIFMIPTMIRTGEERKIAKDARNMIAQFPEDYREDVAYQIGNYYHGECVFADEKLYVVRDEYTNVNNQTKSKIFAVDVNGNCDLVYETEKEIEYGLFYHNGYLYAKIYPNVISIDVNTGESKIVYEGNGYYSFGVADGKLFIENYLEEQEETVIYCYDLNEENGKDSPVLYDSGIDRGAINGPSFVGRYLYNDSSFNTYRLSFHGPGNDEMVYEGYYYYINRYNTYIGNGEFVIWDGIDDTTKIFVDTEVITYNIYNDTLFYVKEFRDDCHEIWSCDLLGENKCYIGTVEQSVMYCKTLGVGEGFVFLEMASDDDYKIRQGYIMHLDDGSVQRIY